MKHEYCGPYTYRITDIQDPYENEASHHIYDEASKMWNKFLERAMNKPFKTVVLDTVPLKFSHNFWANWVDSNKEREEMNEKKDRFLRAGGKYSTPNSENNENFNCSNVLNNIKPDYWYGKDKFTKIIEMNDKHLISVMRWLIENWQLIRGAQLNKLHELRNSNSVWANDRAFAEIEKLILAYKVAPAYLSNNVCSFDRLAEEINHRFGNEALRALYDGF